MTDKLKMADKRRQPRQSLSASKRDGRDTVSAADACIHLQISSTLYIRADGLTIVTRVLTCCRAVTCRQPALNICGKCKLSVSHTIYVQHRDCCNDRSSRQAQGEKLTAHETCLFMALPRYHHFVILPKWTPHMDDVSVHHKNTKLEAIQMDRVNYLHDVPTHSLGSNNTYLHEAELQFMYKRYGVYHFIVKRGPL